MEYLFASFTALCALVLPVALAVVLCIRHKPLWRPILFGALTFTVFQMFLRIPILSVLSQQAWFLAFAGAQPLLYALLLSLTAALFEEGGRWLVISLLLKKQRTTTDGLAFGVGHGGIEAILLVGINVLLVIITGVFPDEPSLLLAAGVERLSAMTLQVGFSIMVVRAVRERKPLWLLLAFALHTLVDLVAVYGMSYLGIWPLEAVFLAFALGVVWFVVREFKKAPPAMEA